METATQIEAPNLTDSGKVAQKVGELAISTRSYSRSEIIKGDWMVENICENSDIDFFPSDASGVTLAKDICRKCPVQAECLEYALINREEHGVWGGTSERARKKMFKKRKIAV